MFKALAHPVRLMILDRLRRRDRCACELQPRFGLDLSTLSRHIAQLKKAGLVTEKRCGVRRMLHLAVPQALDVVRLFVRNRELGRSGENAK